MKVTEILMEQAIGYGMIFKTPSLALYHGAMVEFDEPDFSRIGSESGMEKLKGGWGMYLSESPHVAAQYTPEGKPVIMEFRIAGGDYFNFDALLTDMDFEELMNNLEDYDSNVYERAQDFREEVKEYGAEEYELTGRSFYDIITHDFGSIKETSMFLKYCHFKGNTFLDYTSEARNFVVFDESFIKRI